MKFFKKTISLLLTLAIALSLVAGCNNTLSPALSDGELENLVTPDFPDDPTDPDEDKDPDEEEGEEDEAPIMIVGQQMTMELLQELNANGSMPKITYNDDGTINRIENSGRLDEPKSVISPFPVFTIEDALSLIDFYTDFLDIDENIDLRIDFRDLHSNGILYRFRQYFNDLGIVGLGMTVVADNVTGYVSIIGSFCFKNLDIETTPQISLEEAKQIILYNYNVILSENEEPDLYLYYDRNTDTLDLVWEIYTDNGDQPPNVSGYDNVWYLRISAITGEIVNVIAQWL